MRDHRAARRLRLHNAFLRLAISRGILTKPVPQGITVKYKPICLKGLIRANTRLINYYEGEQGVD